MFTGIIEHVCKVVKNRRDRRVLELWIESGRLSRKLKIGQSIAVNGVCLTIAGLLRTRFKVQVVQETQRCTNLGQLRKGDLVNLEQSLRLSDRLDGHLVLGHVDGVGKVTQVVRDGGNWLLRIQAPRDTIQHLVDKGSVAVEGVSLTVQKIRSDELEVALVPVTLEKTNLGRLRKEDLVNLEVDILSKYVKRHTQRPSGHLTVEFLKQQGF